MESGFSIFFLVVAFGGLGVLAWTVLSNFTLISAALRGAGKSRPAREYTVKLMSPMEHPRVARRLHRHLQQRPRTSTPKGDQLQHSASS